jgi:predicted glycoside hydrolase/deacetylase ChbG (UPF0249 family)
MTADRYLIVNADDFGQSPGVNRGVIQCFEQGIVTSASLMVRWPTAASAAEYARAHPGLSVGLHVDLGEWACHDGEWAPLYTVVAENDAGSVEAEISRQLELFRALVGQDPTHLDSHQHVHRAGPAHAVMLKTSRRLGIPLRHFSPARYEGGFYGQTKDGLPWLEGIGADSLIRTLAALPAGITELGCHPGLGDDVDSMYCAERAQEVQTLCDRRIREALTKEGIELRSFRDVNSLLGRHLV